MITLIADSQKFLAAQEHEIKEKYPETEIVLSNIYSLQVGPMVDAKDGGTLVLTNIGVRYDNVRQHIQDHKLEVYRADKPWELIALLDCLHNSKDATKYLADLNEG